MSGIYPLPENPTAVDIITRSIVAHPSMFREALINQAHEHANYEGISSNPRAQQGARASKLACLNAYDTIGDAELSVNERAEVICGDVGTGVIALNIACKLQCIPSHIRTSAALTLEA